MKDNKGVTLSALVIIIVLLGIFTTFAIYSSVESFKLVDIQKYKAQMQNIQNELDEFYEEYENVYEKNKAQLEQRFIGDNLMPISKDDFLEYYIEYRLTNSSSAIMTFVNNTTSFSIDTKNYENILSAVGYENAKNWWNGNPPSVESVAKQFGITTVEPSVQKQYFFLSKDDIEAILDVKDIDISENFIVNFKKRYVFTETPITVVKKGTENTEIDLYCLYQLDEEQKVIEYNVENSGGTLVAEICEKTQYNQTIKLTLRAENAKIKQVFLDDGSGGNELYVYPTVEEKKDLFEEVRGLGTEAVYIKVKVDGEYNFTAIDMFDELYSTESINIKMHEPPILENNMIPFIATDTSTKGIVYPKTESENVNDWYDYSLYGSDNSKIKYAIAVVTTEESVRNYATIKGCNFDINNPANNNFYQQGTDHIVKVWIPTKMRSLVTTGISFYSNSFIGKNGIWVRAKWDDLSKRWVPDLDYIPYENTTIFEFDGTTIAAGDTTLKDLSRNKYTFTGSGVTFDDVNNCMVFDGKSGSGLKSDTPINFGNEYTIEITFYSEFKNNAFVFDSEYYDNNGKLNGMEGLFVKNNGKTFGVSRIVAGGGKGLYYDQDIQGQINIIQILINKNSYELYLNGNSLGIKYFDTELPSDFNSPFYIGRAPYNTTSLFKGNIFAIRIHNRALSEGELQNNYTRDYNKFYNPLIFEFDGTKINSETQIANIDTSSYRHICDGSGVTLDPVKSCMTFAGQGDGGVYTKEPLKFGNEFTIEICFKPENVNVHLLDARNSDIGIQPIYLYPTYLQVFSSYVGKSCNYSYINNAINIIQMRVENNKLEVRLNNNIISPMPSSEISESNWGTNLSSDFKEILYIGKRHTGNNNFKGNVYSLRIYNKKLEDSELQTNYMRDKNKYCEDYVKTGLQIHYAGFDRGTTNNLWKDISGNGNDGVVVNSSGTQVSGSWNAKSFNCSSSYALESSKNINITENATFEITLKNKDGDKKSKFLMDARAISGSTYKGYQPIYYYGIENNNKNKIQFFNASDTGGQLLGEYIDVRRHF